VVRIWVHPRGDRFALLGTIDAMVISDDVNSKPKESEASA
jgi:hypothetical protein